MGAYYWSFLVRSFAYLDLVFVDTPLRDETLARELATLAEQTKEDNGVTAFIQIRIDRVRRFVAYLCDTDESEIDVAARQGGLYSEPLSMGVREQVENEIEDIKKRTGA